MMRTPRIVRPVGRTVSTGKRHAMPCLLAGRPVHPRLKDVWEVGPSGAGRPSPPGPRPLTIYWSTRVDFVPSRSLAAWRRRAAALTDRRPHGRIYMFASTYVGLVLQIRERGDSDKTVRELFAEESAQQQTTLTRQQRRLENERRSRAAKALRLEL
jgi:hypothetical protein